MPFDVRPCRSREELGRALFAIGQNVHGPPTDEILDRWELLLGLERMHAAFDAGEIVGGAGALPFDLSVPGGSLPCAGVTVVGTYPTHRRRGVLRSLMLAQLDAMHRRDDPIAALWSSEETIYGRFGYGLASWAGPVSIRRDDTAFARPLERRGQVRFVLQDEAKALFPPIWEALRGDRPGMFARTEAWWAARRLRIPDEEQAHPRRFVALEVGGETQAYAIYKQQPGWEGGVPTGKLEVLEALGLNPQATAEIWRFLFDIDLIEMVEASLLPPDHPLFLLLARPRRARYRMLDALWIRLVDVGAALSGRAYAHEGSVVLEVRDELCPWNEGRWKLAGGVAERTDEPAELALDVDALGSAYFGAISFRELREAFRVEELAAGTVARADALFTWRPLPWCPEIF